MPLIMKLRELNLHYKPLIIENVVEQEGNKLSITASRRLALDLN